MTEQNYITLMEGLRTPLYRLALSLLGSSAEAEDAVQDLFERLWDRRGRVVRMDNPAAYAFGSLRNICIDRLRSRNLHSRHHRLLAKEGSVREEPSVVEFDTVSLVSAAIGRLPEPQRTIVHLRDVEGYDYDFIASAVEMSAVAVRVAHSRARLRLKEELTKLMDYGTER